MTNNGILWLLIGIWINITAKICQICRKWLKYLMHNNYKCLLKSITFGS